MISYTDVKKKKKRIQEKEGKERERERERDRERKRQATTNRNASPSAFSPNTENGLCCTSTSVSVVLSCRSPARALAPTSPMALYARFNVVTV